MSLSPLLNESIFIIVHAFAAMFALVVGLIQFAGPKGTVPHRVLGWSWVVAMLIVAISSFWIHGLKQFGNFSWIHVLSVVVLICVPLAIYAARNSYITTHKRTMIGVYAGGLVIAGIFTLLPGRVMYQVVFGG